MPIISSPPPIYKPGGTDVAIADGGTGASVAATARTNLGAAASGANSDITSLSGLTTPLTIPQGGTNASTALAAMTNLAFASQSRAFRNTTQQTITTGIQTKVQLNGESFDVNNEFDSTTNYRFTATDAGYYSCAGAIAYVTPTANKIYYAILNVNAGNQAYAIQHSTTTDDLIVHVSDIFYLNVGNTVQLDAFHNSGVDKNIYNGNYLTYLSIHRLS